MSASIEQRASFGFVRYANCWEDADVLDEALAPAPGTRILSIASGGDNAFRLLAGGAEVVAADLSPAQLACVELKREAIRHLDPDEASAFLGIRPDTQRAGTYRRLRGGLSPEARAFWDRQAEAIDQGFIHDGKFERFFHLFRRRLLPLVHPPRRVEALLADKTRAEREQFYDRQWDRLRWRLLFKLFFSRFVMGRLGRDPEFFRYVDGPVASRILERTRYALTALPTHTNPYLVYILTGNFGGALPPYLQPDVYGSVRDGLDRLILYHGTIQAAARAHHGAGFDGYNLSDIFEYLSPEICRELYGDLLATARPGARLAYWNMLAPRHCPPGFEDRVVSLDALAAELHARDRAFFYSRFVVEEVRR